MKGLEPSTFCMASRADSGEPSTTNASNHAGLGHFRRPRSACFRRCFHASLGHAADTTQIAPSGTSVAESRLSAQADRGEEA